MHYHKKYSLYIKAVSLAVVCLLLVNDIALGVNSNSININRFTLSPPLSSNSLCDIIRNSDGTYDIVTNDRDGVFRNKWAFLDVVHLAGQMLKFTKEEGLETPKEIFVPLIKKALDKGYGPGGEKIEFFDIDSIGEERVKGKVTAFIIPLKVRDKAQLSMKVYLAGDENIKPGNEFTLRDGTRVCVDVDGFPPGAETYPKMEEKELERPEELPREDRRKDIVSESELVPEDIGDTGVPGAEDESDDISKLKITPKIIFTHMFFGFSFFMLMEGLAGFDPLLLWPLTAYVFGTTIVLDICIQGLRVFGTPFSGLFLGEGAGEDRLLKQRKLTKERKKYLLEYFGDLKRRNPLYNRYPVIFTDRGLFPEKLDGKQFVKQKKHVAISEDFLKGPFLKARFRAIYRHASHEIYLNERDYTKFSAELFARVFEYSHGNMIIGVLVFAPSLFAARINTIYEKMAPGFVRYAIDTGRPYTILGSMFVGIEVFTAILKLTLGPVSAMWIAQGMPILGTAGLFACTFAGGILRGLVTLGFAARHPKLPLGKVILWAWIPYVGFYYALPMQIFEMGMRDMLRMNKIARKVINAANWSQLEYTKKVRVRKRAFAIARKIFDYEDRNNVRFRIRKDAHSAGKIEDSLLFGGRPVLLVGSSKEIDRKVSRLRELPFIAGQTYILSSKDPKNPEILRANDWWNSRHGLEQEQLGRFNESRAVGKESSGTVMLSVTSKMGRIIERQLDMDFSRNGFGKDAVVKQVVFVGSRRQENAVRKRLKAYYGKMPATSFVYQKPLGGDIAIEIIAEPREEVKVTRISDKLTVVEKLGIKEAHVAGIRPVWWRKDPYKQIQKAFTEARTELDKAGFNFAEDVKRIWLYQKNITGNYFFFSERYQRLNDGRDVFFTEEGMKGRGWYPASTGIGMSGSSMLLECLAIKGDERDVMFEPLENPESTNAHEYDKENVLKKGVHKTSKPPLFSRGLAVIKGDHTRIYISGTASVKGPNVVHPGDVEKQTSTTIENIGIVLSRGGAELEDISQLRVYVKNPEDFQKVKAIVEAKFPHAPPTIYLHADVCRDGWLVEIEAVADKTLIKPERTEMAVRSFNHGAFTDPTGPVQGMIGGAEEADYYSDGLLDLDHIVNESVSISRDIKSLEEETRLNRGKVARPIDVENRLERLYSILEKVKNVDDHVAKACITWQSRRLEVTSEKRSDVDNSLETLVRNNAELMAIIENRIRFSKGETKKEKCEFNTLIEDIEERCFHKDDAISFIKGGFDGSDGFSVWLDKISISNAIANILTNAKQAVTGSENPHIYISLERKGDEAVITISDNGSGIPKKDLIKGYHGMPRFAAMNFTTKERGTGLGTPEAWFTVEDHGGTIDVESQVGKGTSFKIKLPLDDIERSGMDKEINDLPESEEDGGKGSNPGENSLRPDGILPEDPPDVSQSGYADEVSPAIQPDETGVTQNDEELKPEFQEQEAVHVKNFRSLLGYLKAQENDAVQESKEKVSAHLLVVGKSWLKGYTKGADQYDAFNPLIILITKYCQKKKIPFIIVDDEDIPGIINVNMSENTRVIALTGTDGDGKLPEEIAKLSKNEYCKIVGIDSRDMDPNGYIRIMEILTIALRLSIGIEPEELELGYMSIIPPGSEYPVYMIIPHSEPEDYKLLKIMYQVQINA